MAATTLLADVHSISEMQKIPINSVTGRIKLRWLNGVWAAAVLVAALNLLVEARRPPIIHRITARSPSRLAGRDAADWLKHRTVPQERALLLVSHRNQDAGQFTYWLRYLIYPTRVDILWLPANRIPLSGYRYALAYRSAQPVLSGREAALKSDGIITLYRITAANRIARPHPPGG
ncbi:MAG: hypothetical protein M1330_00475 [Armatimonadetes bacterium]|nr:hypothetical protein [Armatimonadota bacterium]